MLGSTGAATIRTSTPVYAPVGGLAAVTRYSPDDPHAPKRWVSPVSAPFWNGSTATAAQPSGTNGPASRPTLASNGAPKNSAPDADGLLGNPDLDVVAAIAGTDVPSTSMGDVTTSVHATGMSIDS